MKPIQRDRTPEEEEDLRLICRVKEGDIDSFALLAGRHRKRMETFLFRLFGDRQKAEDGAQELFLRLWTSRHRYEPRSRLTTLLYQIAYRYWQDEARKTRSRPEEVEWVEVEAGAKRAAPLAAPAVYEPHHQLFLHYRQRQIRDAIAGLPERYRLVFMLAHLEERRIREIAEILGIPEGTAKSRLHTAVKLLRDTLIQEENEGER